MTGEEMFLKRAGIVAMIDVLGVKGSWAEGAADGYMTTWSSLVKSLEVFTEDICKRLKLERADVQISTFSDTLIITASGEDLAGRLSVVTSQLMAAFNFSLMSGIFLRGVLSFGEFRQSRTLRSFVVGPAVDDAAEWYGRPDWLGISATPKLTYKIDYMVSKGNKGLKAHLVRCPVPLKGGSTCASWALAWPRTAVLFEHGVGGRCFGRKGFREAILHAFSRRSVDPSVAGKYDRTLKFYEEVLSRKT